MRIPIFLILSMSVALAACSGSSPQTEAQAPEDLQAATRDTVGLKDYYEPYFPIGVAVSPAAMEGPEAELIKTHFISMTPENVMKMGPIHPEPDRYNWEPADKIVDFARENDLKMRGHALVWHQQTPDWFFTYENGEQISKEELFKRMEEHITTVVTRYKDDIYAWDVVNEAVADDQSRIYRESIFHEIAGKEYIAKAFEYARAADPDVELYYNDYNIVRPEKRARTYQLLKELIDAGVPIDGVGIQGHWSIFEPSEEEVRAAIEQYASLGLKVQITELDVSIYPWEKHTRQAKADESDEFTPELEQKQLEKYDMFFRVFRDYKDVLTGVTFWNISDRHSWLDHYPVPGRKNYPLLFDQDLQPKKVYWEVVNFENEEE